MKFVSDDDDDDDDDCDDDGGDDDIYIMIQCLFVTFIPAPPPAQSCYVWIKRKVESRK